MKTLSKTKYHPNDILIKNYLLAFIIEESEKVRIRHESRTYNFPYAKETLSDNNELKVACWSLFPQDSKTQLLNQEMKMNTLRLLDFFVGKLIETITAFYIENKFSEFDPHVGDTLCQIRAYMMLSIANSELSSRLESTRREVARLKNIQQLIKQKIAEFENLINTKSSKYNKVLDSSEQLDKFLDVNGLVFNITEEHYFITQARLLTLFSKVDAQGISRGIHYDKLCHEAGISKTLAKRMMHNYQQNISSLSCQFIFRLLNELPGHRELQLLLHRLQYTDKDKRNVLPCYPVTQILMAHILSKQFPVLIMIERQHNVFDQLDDKMQYFLFAPTKEGNDFELCPNIYPFYFEKPCIVVKGALRSTLTMEPEAEFLDRFMRLGLTKILLANMAKHPQYSAHEFEAISVNPYQGLLSNPMALSETEAMAASLLEQELIAMQSVAEQEGCCMDNPALFLVKHILCDTPENQLSPLGISPMRKMQNLPKGYPVNASANYPLIEYDLSQSLTTR